MTLRPRDPKYYVVGGPVQPERDCYLCRNADSEILRRLSDGEYCHVLAQRQTGKTSLAISTARKLRSLGTSVAMVDLTQASGEDPSENAGRWYYSIAYRIVRDLRIKAELQTWWKERGGLTNLQRLREFFLEVVLMETTTPVVIVFDRIEATRDEPLAQELFAAVRACFDSRATDPSFQRLTFVLFGTAMPAEIVNDVQGSVFGISAAVELSDFSAQETAGLMAGLGEPLYQAQDVMSRVWTWTRGNPYLTQKVFRGLARRRDDELDIASVDDLVTTQFLAPNSLREESHLAAIAERLLLPSPTKSARLNLYGRIRKGVDISYDSTSEVQNELITCGVVDVGEDGVLRVRNEIYAAVFNTRWVNQNLPYGLNSIGIAAAIAVCVLAIPIWYTEYLPRPYVNALSAANEDFQVAEDAYNSLHMMPGYARTADRLFGDFLSRSSRSVQELPEMMRVYDRVLQVPGSEGNADKLLAEFWHRKAVTAAHAGDRDSAIMSVLQALNEPTAERRRFAAELLGEDYQYLQSTLHADARIEAIAADQSTPSLTVLDANNRVVTWSIVSDQPGQVGSLQLVAEEQPLLEERRQVLAVAGRPRLLIDAVHQRPEQVSLTLRSPGGEKAQLNLADGEEIGGGLRAFDFAADPQLRRMLGGEMVGNWALAVADLEPSVQGELRDWFIVGGSNGVLPDNSAVPQPIPEPVATDNVRSVLSTDGRFALSWPAGRSGAGALLVWDVRAGEVVTRLPAKADFVDAQFVLDGERVLTRAGSQLELRETKTGVSLGQIPVHPTETVDVTVTGEGRYIALTDLSAKGGYSVVVWSLQTMSPVGQPLSVESPGPLAVDGSGGFVAIGGRDLWVRVWSLNRNRLFRELEHTSPPRSLLFDGTGQWLVTDDLSNTLRLWDISSGDQAAVERLGSGPWRADFAADSSRVLFGSSDRGYETVSLPDAGSSGQAFFQSALDSRAATFLNSPGPLLLDRSNLVVANDAGQTIKIWRLPAVSTGGRKLGRSLPGDTRAALSPDGKLIAIGRRADDVRVFAIGAPGEKAMRARETNQLTEPPELVTLRFSSDRRLLAGASLDGRIEVWRTPTGERLDVQILHPDGAAHDLLFVGASQFLVSASRREVIVTRLADNSVMARLRIQADHPQLAVAQETGELFIADDLDGVTSWNWRTGQSDRIVGTEGDVRKVAVNVSGSRLVTASDERVLTVWDVFSRTPMERQTRVAGKVDDMWVVDGDSRLVLQSGPWLQTLTLSPTGLAPLHTRLLTMAPDAVQPLDGGRFASVLAAAPGRPEVRKLALDKPGATALEGEVADLQQAWRNKLRLEFDDSGVPQPLQNAAELQPDIADAG